MCTIIGMTFRAPPCICLSPGIQLLSLLILKSVVAKTLKLMILSAEILKYTDVCKI